jgi:hypothetical protein
VVRLSKGLLIQLHYFALTQLEIQSVLQTQGEAEELLLRIADIMSKNLEEGLVYIIEQIV